MKFPLGRAAHPAPYTLAGVATHYPPALCFSKDTGYQHNQGSGMLSSENDDNAPRGRKDVPISLDSASLGCAGTHAGGLPEHFLLSVSTGFSPLDRPFKVMNLRKIIARTMSYQYLLPPRNIGRPT